MGSRASAVLFAFVFLCGAASAAPPRFDVPEETREVTPSLPPADAGSTYAEHRIVCRRLQYTGSRRIRRVCLPQQDWISMQEEGEEVMDGLRDHEDPQTIGAPRDASNLSN